MSTQLAATVPLQNTNLGSHLMAPQDVMAEAMELFPTNLYLRTVHACREATIYGRTRTDLPLSPRVVSPFLVGHAGYGKTSSLRYYAEALGIGYIERGLAGINDIAEVLGMVDRKINEQTGEMETILAKPSWWPKEGTQGILNFDDWTRANTSIISAVMPLADGSEVNGLRLPIGWTIAFTGNPEDEYSVTSLDDAQSSRAIVMAYNRPNETFFEQMELQQFDPDLKDFWTTDTAQVDAKICTVTPPPNNDRTKALFNHIYRYIKHDQDALIMVSNSMFGSEWYTAFNAIRSGTRPPRPEQILNDYDSVKGRIYEAKENQRTDILASMTHQLISHMVVKGPSAFTKEQYLNFEQYAMMMTNSEINRLVKSLAAFSDAIGEATMTVVNGTRQNGEYSRKAAEIRREIRQLDV